MPDSPDSRLDSFATFLNTIQSGAAEGSSRLGPSLKVMTVLGDSPKPLHDVRNEAGLDFVVFNDTIKGMLDQNLVTVMGKPGEETVDLTPSGRDVKSTLK